MARGGQGFAAGLEGRGARRRPPCRGGPDRLHAPDGTAVVYRQPVLRRAAPEPGRCRDSAGGPAGAGGAGAAFDAERQDARVATAAGPWPAATDAAAAAAAATPA